jgi:subtilase family serine protease
LLCVTAVALRWDDHPINHSKQWPPARTGLGLKGARMRGYSTRFTGFFISCLLLAGCSGGAVPVGTTTLPSQQILQAQGAAQPVCPQIVGKPTCLALIGSKGGVSPTVGGLEPSDFQTRYKLPSSTKGSGQIVAIVDPYDNPNVAADLAAYRAEFGLGTANFTKYNQQGQTSNYPAGSTSWGLNKDLETEMVSAACPKCTIDLIEANSGDAIDLEAAELEAVKLGAHIVANGWICYNSNACVFSSDFDTPGVVYLAASGNEGYDEIGAPAVFASVVSVGGTILTKISSSDYNEVVWPDSGAGCATGVTKPSWQHDPDCASRTVADVSAVAQNVAIYDTYGYNGWFTSGGTAAATALNAGVFGLAGNASSQNAAEKFWTLSKKKRNKELHYISVGNDGSCGGEYLCQAGTKQFGTYSGPAGWGTPNGIKAY